MHGFLIGVLAASVFIVTAGSTMTLYLVVQLWSEPINDSPQNPDGFYPDMPLEHWRPLYHHTPQAKWISDPSGLLRHIGEYHMFDFQNTSWGHAVSQDLVLTWTELRPAILADLQNMIQSGSALVVRERESKLGTPGSTAMFAYYSGVPSVAPHHRQQSLVAFSLDLGRTWMKYEENPVIGGNQTAFRYPKAIQVPEGWMMLLELSEKRSFSFFKSIGLSHGRQVRQFPNAASTVNKDWEHPDLFQLEEDGNPGNKKWILIVNSSPDNQYGIGSSAQCFLGDFDGERFIADDDGAGGKVMQWLDHGMDYHAEGSFVEMPGSRRVMIGWMSNWAYGERVPTGTSTNGMSVAREVQLRTISGRLQLTQQPVQGLDALRRGPMLHGSGILLQDGEHTKEDMQGQALDIQVAFTWIDAAEFGTKVHVSRDRETVIGFRKKQGGFELFVDRTNSGVDNFSNQFAGVHQAPVQPDKDGKLVMRILVDAASVEVFGGQGEVVITDLVFPEETDDGVSFYSVGGSAQIDEFQLWRSSPIERK